jgi:hydrogenase maturation protease
MDGEADCLVFLDAVSSGAPAGMVHRLDAEEAFPSGGAPTSLHHLGLRETLGLARALGRNFSAVVLGVECEAIGPGWELTARLSAMLPDMVEAVTREIMKIYRTISVSPTTVC